MKLNGFYKKVVMLIINYVGEALSSLLPPGGDLGIQHTDICVESGRCTGFREPNFLILIKQFCGDHVMTIREFHSAANDLTS